MFGGNNTNKDNNKTTSTSTTSKGGLNSLVRGTVVEGTVQSENDIRIDGTIKGKLLCSAKVIIGPTGRVEGEIRCQNAVVEGEFEGTLEVKALLDVREKAKVTGTVSTDKLVIQSGAAFNVTCSMGGAPKAAPVKAGQQPAAKQDSIAAKTTKPAGARN